MKIHKNNITIFFGDAQHPIDREFFNQAKTQAELEQESSLHYSKQALNIESLFFTKQIHSAQGIIISQENYTSFLTMQPEGDFLITNKTHVGLGIYTADCLPIVIYDPEHHAVALAHAGWMGSVQEIAVKAMQALEKTHGSQKNKVHVYFGPAAGVCCYIVQPDFRENLTKFSFADQVIIKHDNQLYFDLLLFNKLQLVKYGVSLEAFNQSYTQCTIHNASFCSYRRDNKNTARNVTLVALKNQQIDTL
ncbi:peptidoglycan editing factor PgeF [Candidatus Dependentiae bacterium]|nr:peptidoglycan editing factor PgeF [Candidatus Dependentiae bacterium]